MHISLHKHLRLLTALALWTATCQSAAALPVEKLRLPPGFQIEVLSDQVPNARQLAMGSGGTLYAGSRRAGRVYAIRTDRPQRPPRVQVILDHLEMPSGIALHDGDLYVADINRVLRLPEIEGHGASDYRDLPRPELVTAALPADYHHGWKFIGFGPDGLLYIPVGVPCNVCRQANPWYGTILRMDPRQPRSAPEIFARGVRNSVGFDWHPVSGELWFTDNGRDHMGDDVPPDELNRVRAAGEHFGFPHFHGGDVPDPTFGPGHKPGDFSPPVLKIQAHSAPLGMRFYTGDQFPEAYRGRIFIAEHGSWNRSSKVGYQVTMVTLDAQQRVVDYRPFVEGWLEGERNWGRPADVLVAPDGSLLIADDQAGAIYRVTWHGTQK